MRNLILVVLIFVFTIEAKSQLTTNEVTAAKPFNRSFAIQPFSPITGSLKLNYSQVVVKNLTLDFGIGIVGPNTGNVSTNSSGMTAKSGLKMYFSPDYYTDDMKKFSDFQGAYFEPELAVSVFNYNYLYESTSKQIVSSAILLNFGKQRVVGNRFLIDTWAGFGYCFGGNEDYDEPANRYEFVALQELGLAFTSGFAIGFLTK